MESIFSGGKSLSWIVSGLSTKNWHCPELPQKITRKTLDSGRNEL